ncbi:putative ribonuclease T(2) [Rosa chinensis]|uniref:Putative ribonuclease T(2) n=1 Tax=Rosa chinensis TaxID=74649 RepID=A0A2P6R2Y0_ROSCH|nr:putative ribonuclease T(2) [Rosa chinensis]
MHGTCSQSVLDRYNYFFHATGLRDTLKDIHGYLQDYGIRPDGTAYNLNTQILSEKIISWPQ